jgi:hypothetical protein
MHPRHPHPRHPRHPAATHRTRMPVDSPCSARFGQVARPLARQWHGMMCGAHAMRRGSLWSFPPYPRTVPPHRSRASRRCSVWAARHRVALAQRVAGAHVGVGVTRGGARRKTKKRCSALWPPPPPRTRSASWRCSEKTGSEHVPSAGRGACAPEKRGGRRLHLLEASVLLGPQIATISGSHAASPRRVLGTK